MGARAVVPIIVNKTRVSTEDRRSNAFEYSVACANDTTDNLSNLQIIRSRCRAPWNSKILKMLSRAAR